ncbi:MAG: TlpA disulfide reductase family protein [Candidatus Acidiferrales bacterium]
MRFPNLARKIPFFVLSAALILALSGSTAAQTSPQPSSQSTSNRLVQVSSTQPSADAAKPTQPAPSETNFVSFQPPSQPTVADAARLARAKKNAAAAKSAKVIDDDNLSKTPRDAAEYALDASFNAAAQGPGASASSHGGKVTVLDFWATWCGPCRQSVPDLKQLQAAYGDRLEVVSISEDHDERTWQNFVSQNGMTWTQRFDANAEEMRRYGANALPTYIILDDKGTVIGRLVGEDPSTPLADRLAPIIGH